MLATADANALACRLAAGDPARSVQGALDMRVEGPIDGLWASDHFGVVVEIDVGMNRHGKLPQCFRKFGDEFEGQLSH